MNQSTTRTGLTLLELLLVMTIVGIVFGLGLGAITGLDLSKGADAELVRGALRATRASALAARHPAAFLVGTDAASGRATLRVQRMRTVGTWHFERPDGRGTDELAAAPIGGARQIDDGYLGRAIGFGGGAGRGARVEIAIDTLPSYDVRDGFSLELQLRLEDAGRGGTVFSLGGRTRVAGLECTDGGGLTGWVAPVFTDETGRERTGGRIDIKLPPGTLLLDRWMRVAIVYDGARLRIVVDGFLAGTTVAEGPLGALDGPLTLGGEPAPFPGSIDTLVLRTIEISDPLLLSDQAVWPAGLPRRIDFDADGSLDAYALQGPLEIVLATDPEEPVYISRMGVVD